MGVENHIRISMQQYLVSIEVDSTNLTLDDISSILDLKPIKESRKGMAAKITNKCIWRYKSTASKNASLAQHVDNILTNIKDSNWETLNTKNHGSAMFRIGVLYDDAMCMFDLPHHVIMRISALKMSLDISAYPSTF